MYYEEDQLTDIDNRDRSNRRWRIASVIGGIIVALGLIVLFFSSCTATRDRHSLARVMGKDSLKEIVGKSWEKSNPCTTRNDTTFLPGKSDSVFITLPVGDTGVKRRLLRVIEANSKDCDKQVADAYDVGYQQARTEIAGIKIPLPVHDTLRLQTEDTRRLQLAQLEVSKLTGSIEQLTKDKAAEHSRGNKWMWLFIGLGALNIIAAAIAVYIKIIKSKLTHAV